MIVRIGRVFNTVGLHADGARELRQPLLVLFSGAGILLLIACVNVASCSSRARRRVARLDPQQVVRLVVREGVRLAATGAAIGGFGALVAAQALRAQLFGITPRDLPSYAIAAAVIAASAIASLASRKSKRRTVVP